MAEEHTEHSVFTWDPVGQRWIHERGPEMTTPPVPPDVHAIQTYFFDADEKEWIATVLAPRGRALAAQWEGAHKVPDHPTPSAQPVRRAATKAGPPVPLFAIVLVLLIVGGGAAAVVAGTQSAPNSSPSARTSVPGGSAHPSAPVAVSGEPTATPDGSTPDATQAPGGTPVVRRTPARTPVPTAPPPMVNAITLADGSVVTYDGPARMDIGVPFAVTFTVRTAGNGPGTGTFLLSIGNTTTGGQRSSSGTLDPGGRIVVQMNGFELPGNYPFVVNYQGHQGQISILRVG